MFVRLLGVVYLCAFWSLGVQVRGLFGHAGILPVADLLANASRWLAIQSPGASKLLALPTLFWFNSSDATLVGVCVAGVVASLLLVAGLAPAPILTLLWFLYLSLLNVGQTFLAFQWDALLVETGFLAIFIAPWAWTDGNTARPPAVARWLIWWLLFRLMLGSGIVKLTSGDPTWRNLTALSFHYETQPLPTPAAWYIWLLPGWLHQITTGATLAIELIAPWFIPIRRARPIVCGCFIALQLIIASTGNYAFFNLLTIALSLTLLDDRLGIAPRHSASAPSIAAAILTVPISLVILCTQAGIGLPGRSLLAVAEPIVTPFRIVNAYGLFAVMTTTRPELIVEGTADGITWKPYVFKYKPAPDHATLAWVAPHQPRLDWQMWFAALGQYEAEEWFEAFRQRLLDGSPDVIGLLAANPFPERPPIRVRVTRQVYRFATRNERHATGSVWQRVL